MKNLFTLKHLIVAAILPLAISSCNVDSSYDLSESLDNSEMGFGTDDTSFELPLLNINIQASKFTASINDDKASVTRSSNDNAFLAENLLNTIDDISSLLPSTPDGEKIDITKLGDEEYVSEIVDELFVEISTDSEKREAFAKSAMENKSEADPDFAELITQLEVVLGAPLESFEDTNSCADAIKKAIDDEDNAAVTDLKSSVTETVIDNSKNIRTVFEVREKIHDTIELGDDIMNMLDKNLDGDKNTLSLLFRVSSNLPFDITLTPAIELSTGEVIAISEFKEAVNHPGFDRTSITKEQFRSMLDGMTFTSIIKVENYDPSKGDLTLDGKSIYVQLIARKTGSIIL